MPTGAPSPPVGVLRAAYEAFGSAVRTVNDERSWLPTECAGWAVRDLIRHCWSDATRGLVALHTPADGPVDRDAVSYWRDWRPDGPGAENARRFTRVIASMFLHVDELRDAYLEAAAAVVDAAEGVAADRPVRTQGRVLVAGDLMRTLAVEVTIHHLDVGGSLPQAPGPSAEGLGEVRRTLDGLLGHPAPGGWSDERYARIGTGRVAPADAELADLGPDAERLPLFG